MEREVVQGLRQAATQLGLALRPEVEEGLERYQPLLERWSKRVRLVGSVDPATVALKHFADSLTLLPFLEGLSERSKLVDIGSGAGFPGIPLGLARPDLLITMVEGDARKAAFLLSAVATLDRENMSVVAVSARGEPEEEGVPLGAAVVSRALMDPGRWMELGKHYLEPGGLLVAMMGAAAPQPDELRALGASHGLDLAKTWEGELPGAGRRTLAGWRSPVGSVLGPGCGRRE